MWCRRSANCARTFETGAAIHSVWLTSTKRVMASPWGLLQVYARIESSDADRSRHRDELYLRSHHHPRLARHAAQDAVADVAVLRVGLERGDRKIRERLIERHVVAAGSGVDQRRHRLSRRASAARTRSVSGPPRPPLRPDTPAR